MDKEYFLNAGTQPPIQFEPNTMQLWNSFSSAQELNGSSDQTSSSCFLNSFAQLDSTLSSMTHNSADNPFALRELIRKLGPVCNSGDISHPFPAPTLPALSADPGFAERAAKFSCLGSRSFNGRTSQFGDNNNNAELPYRSSTPKPESGGKLSRVSSSPLLLKQDGNVANSNEESSVLSEQVASGELNSKKRKAVSRGKAKEDSSSQVAANKGIEQLDADTNAKRSKTKEANKTEDDKANQKPPEPPKDYIHVRARRGQATDSHSLAERVRREKISERMKLLQDLVPGCNKVTGKALMLDEIINYVQSLQRQVEFLSMKLASVDPRLDTMANLLSKDAFQPNASLPHPLFPLDSLEPGLYKNQPQHSPQLHNNGTVDQIDITLFRNLGLQLPPLDGFTKGLSQFPALCEDDLHSIVQMGYSQNPDRDAALHSQTFTVANQSSHMKIEL
ncbi:hypothetical protein ACH5RR_020441 [Cinchona calisaya]|uniref:BHLH domain-containing protein n=1 Tax=Cinchona calisaya TaxID=153742 RepID=A0ABD2ZHF9_9GENT